MIVVVNGRGCVELRVNSATFVAEVKAAYASSPTFPPFSDPRCIPLVFGDTLLDDLARLGDYSLPHPDTAPPAVLQHIAAGPLLSHLALATSKSGGEPSLTMPCVDYARLAATLRAAAREAGVEEGGVDGDEGESIVKAGSSLLQELRVFSEDAESSGPFSRILLVPVPDGHGDTVTVALPTYGASRSSIGLPLQVSAPEAARRGIATAARHLQVAARDARSKREALVPAHTASTLHILPMREHGHSTWGRDAQPQGRGRVFARHYLCHAGPRGHAFSLLPQCEGRWAGDATIVYPPPREGDSKPRVVATSLVWVPPGAALFTVGVTIPASSTRSEGVWLETETVVGPDSIAHVTAHVLVPTAAGECRVEALMGGDHPGSGSSSNTATPSRGLFGGGRSEREVEVTLREVEGSHGGIAAGVGAGAATLLLTAVDAMTRTPKHVELITVQPDGLSRTRLVQRFSRDGILSCVVLITEERVIDSVTGALTTTTVTTPVKSPSPSVTDAAATMASQTSTPPHMSTGGMTSTAAATSKAAVAQALHAVLSQGAPLEGSSDVTAAASVLNDEVLASLAALGLTLSSSEGSAPASAGSSIARGIHSRLAAGTLDARAASLIAAHNKRRVNGRDSAAALVAAAAEVERKSLGQLPLEGAAATPAAAM